MNFTEILPQIVKAFDENDVGYALIGGLAMAFRGVQRATLDADFILLSENLETCDAILGKIGYRREFHSENVTHYVADDRALGRVDFLHAFRPATLGMLNRAERIQMTANCQIPVVHTEDLIGLKLQAAVNDPDRAIGDWNDIYMLVDHSARTSNALDWELITDYLNVFGLGAKLNPLKQRYGDIATK